MSFAEAFGYTPLDFTDTHRIGVSEGKTADELLPVVIMHIWRTADGPEEAFALPPDLADRVAVALTEVAALARERDFRDWPDPPQQPTRENT